MGLLVDGEWRDKWYDTDKHGGEFKREDAAFRNWITADGSSGFKAEADRYHLYVAYACPWAHRTLVMRKLKGLEEVIPVTVVDPLMLEHGWTMLNGQDTLHGKRYLHEVYTLAKSDYTGRVTVPTLWDKKENTIVSNESAEIIRMFNSAFGAFARDDHDYYPEDLRGEIDAVNDRVYSTVNNGVYKAGFATSQEAYERHVRPLFESLDWLEERLSTRRYLCGERLTEADWRLWTTLLRFDLVYYAHFKCNIKRLRDYPNLWAYTRELYQWPGIKDTLDLDETKTHYYGSQRAVNPTGVVPVGPTIDYDAPHGRDLARLAAE